MTDNPCSPRDDGFCDECGIVLDLHPYPDEDDLGCGVALAKADLMDRFFGTFAR